MAGRDLIVNLIGDATKFSKTLKDAGDDAEKFGGKVGGHLSSIGDSIGKMAKTSLMVGIPAVVGFGVAAVKAFSESELVAAQTEAALKSTGSAAHVTAGHISDLAGKLSMLSGVDDEVIQSGENILLTFTNIQNKVGAGNDIFDQATSTVLDLSTALHLDMQSASIMVGKALNNLTVSATGTVPALSALRRVGVRFTEDQEKQVAALIRTGDIMGAQKIILGELNTEVGGSAKAAGDTFAGSLNKLKVIIGNFMEMVGGKLVPLIIIVANFFSQKLPAALGIFSPLVDKLKAGWTSFISAIKGFSGGDQGGGIIGVASKIGDALQPVYDLIQQLPAGWNSFVSALRGFSGGDQGGGVIGVASQMGDILRTVINFVKNNAGPVFAAFGVVLGTLVVAAVWSLVAAIGALFSPVVLVVGAIALVAAGVVYAYQHFKTFHDIIDQLKDVFMAAFDAIQRVVLTAIAVVSAIWGQFGDFILDTIKTAFVALAEIIRGALNVLTGIFNLIKDVLTGKWGKVWDDIKQIVTGAWDMIFGYVRGVGHILGGIIGGLGGVITSAASGIWDGIKSGFKSAINWIIDQYNSFTSHIPSIHIPGTNITAEYPTMKHLAMGGPINGLALVGENGPELFQGSGTITPNNKLGGLGGSNKTYNINVYAFDTRDGGEAVVKSIQDYERSNGSDWRAA